MTTPHHVEHSTNGATLADILERVLDKGIVIAGDIKVKLVEIELLTIQIRLVVCSVDKAKELGLDWWVNHPAFSRHQQDQISDSMRQMEDRLAKLEGSAPVPRQAQPVPAEVGGASGPLPESV
jgi:Gas vesicle protein